MKKHELSLEELRGVDVLSRMSESELRAWLTRFHGIAFDKGDEIVTYGDDSRDVYFIVSGRARVNMYALSGRQVTFELLDAGQMFGELAAIDGLSRSASVEAESDTVAARMTPGDFNELLNRSPAAARAVFERMAACIRWLTAKVYEHSALTARGRFALELLRLSADRDDEPPPWVISPAPTDRDFASRIGVARERVSGIMSSLRDAGLARRDGRAIRILDPQALREVLDDEVVG